MTASAILRAQCRHYRLPLPFCRILQTFRHSRRTSNEQRGQQSEGRVPLCLPFISDRVSRAIKECLRQVQLEHDVVLVNVPNDNIKRQLVRNRLYDRTCISRDCVICPYGNDGDCARSGVVYQIECLSCHATYIGETGRPLSVRMKEHMASKRRESLISPLGKHRRGDHNGAGFDVKCTTLAIEESTSVRKALEAAWIFARTPKINGRNEQLFITSDLMPFVGLCRL